MKINELVTRKKYHNDIVFRVIGILEDKVVLKGEFIRIFADAPVDDLISYESNGKNSLVLPKISEEKSISKGKILHIDGDQHYLKKAMEAYSLYNIKAIGYYIQERDLPLRIEDIIKKHSPDIVVITGHDSLKANEDKNDISSYKNSLYFIEATKIAREIRPDKDDLIIVVGACQSFFEALIDAGANFASSPNRNNIHLLDPVIVASFIANSRINSKIDIEYILANTISKEIGGIETFGKARKLYLGGS